MKKLNIFLSVFIVTGLCFWALIGISNDNQYTSVRKYTKPKVETEIISQNIPEVVESIIDIPVQKTTDITPPMIEFLNYKDGDVVTLPLVNILVKVTDDQSSPDKITIDGAGRKRLINGFNPIVVTATDDAGNVGSTYIVIEKQ